MKKLFACLLAMTISVSLFGCGIEAAAAETADKTPAEKTEQKSEQKPEGTAVVYETERDPFTKEEIQAFLKTQGVELVEEGKQTDERDRTYSVVHGICTDGADYTIAQYQGEPSLPLHFGFSRPDAKLYGAYPIYNSEWDAQTSPELRVHQMFETPKELSFCSKEDAEKKVREALDALGLHDLQLLRTLYLDKDTLRKANERVCEDPQFAPISEEAVPFNGYNLRQWDEREEAYMFGFGMKTDDIPNTVHLRGVEEGDRNITYGGTEVTVCYNRHGIVSVSAEAPFLAKKAMGEPQKLCGPEIAEKAAQEEVDSIRERQKNVTCKIEKPQLEYGCVKENGSYCLKPLWRVSFSLTSQVEKWGDLTSHHQVFVDAVTGENITWQKLP